MKTIKITIEIDGKLYGLTHRVTKSAIALKPLANKKYIKNAFALLTKKMKQEGVL